MPLFKKGDKSLTSNYRPISSTSNVGQLFECIIFKHLYNYISENELLYKYQSGFLPGHSTVHHLIELTHNICISLETMRQTAKYFDIYQRLSTVYGIGVYCSTQKNMA